MQFLLLSALGLIVAGMVVGARHAKAPTLKSNTPEPASGCTAANHAGVERAQINSNG